MHEPPTEHNTCPCGSGLDYAQCCGLCHGGERPAQTAEQLMRSRYTAYVRADRDYLLNTWHPATRPGRLELSDQPIWQRLEVLDCVGGQGGDVEGVVEFAAHYLSRQGPGCLRERSRFRCEAGRWVYVDGQQQAEPLAKPRGKTGRNAPCPCGSGRKYKQCCGR